MITYSKTDYASQDEKVSADDGIVLDEKYSRVDDTR
jgi:hypothetical protein